MTFKHSLVLATLAATLAGVSGLASAQMAAPPTANTSLATDKASTEADRTQLRSDRSKTKADRQRYKADKAAGNTAAAQADKAQLKADKQAKQSERSMVNGAHSTSEAARHRNKQVDGGEPAPATPTAPAAQ